MYRQSKVEDGGCFRMKNRMYFKRIIVFLIILVVVINYTYLPVRADSSNGFSDTEKIYVEDGYTVTMSLTSSWGSGYNANVVIENTSAETIQNWYISFTFDSEISNIWNAVIYDSGAGAYVIRNAEWNQDIPVSGNVSFGFSANVEFPGFPDSVIVTSGYYTTAPEDYSVIYSLESEWNDGFNGLLTITNNTSETLEDWVLEFDYDRNIESVWNCIIESHEGNHYIIRNSGENGNILPGTNKTFGFSGTGGISTDEPHNFQLINYGHFSSEVNDGNDTDGDGLEDEVENLIGTDPELEDTDGDGLTDYQELYLTFTNPLNTDSDDDGIDDAEEDLDSDGLTNISELQRGLDLSNPDSDRDGLSDYEEIFIYDTNPLDEDTDGEGLTDGDDVFLGFDPLLQDTDLNGILDCDEKIDQIVENDFSAEDGRGITNVSVSMNVSGNIDKEVSIANIYDFDELSANVSGLVGVPIEINSNAEFDTALITFTYNEDELGDTDESELSLMWYDEENHWFQILDEDSIVDTVNNTVSYTTTHFSKYLLVNKNIWFETWNAAVDYGQEIIAKNITGEKDFVFVVEESKTLNLDLIDSINELEDGLRNCAGKGGINDVGKVSVETNVITWYQFNPWDPPKGKCIYYDKDAGDSVLLPYHGNNMDTVLKNAIYAFDYKPDLYKNDDKYIIVISNGDFSVSNDVINACKEKGLVIYALDVDESIAANKFKQLAELTGGRYYSGELLNDPELLMNIIVNEIRYDTNLPDSDGDGLIDLFETTGMICQNGTIIKTNPFMKDSDGDNLTDYRETGRVYCLNNAYIGKGIFKDVKLIVMSSDPTKPDTDGDGLDDDDDLYPMKSECLEITVDNCFNFEFIKIDQYDGGDQNWWMSQEEFEILSNEGKLHNYNNNENYRTRYGGCGLVAASDLEIYLAQNSNYQRSPIQAIPSYGNDGVISKMDYMNYVNNNRDNVYFLDEGLIGFYAGLAIGYLESGFKNYLVYNCGKNIFVKWGDSNNPEIVLRTIKKMINDDHPVVCSYYSPKKHILYFYKTTKDASNNSKQNYDLSATGHYFTIIGYVRYYDAENNTKYLLKVASNGGVYYVNYDVFSAELSTQSNILEYYYT